MTIKAVLFDLWGTLIHDRAGEIGETRVRLAHEALANLGFSYDAEAVRAAFARAGDELGRIHAEGLDVSAEARTILYLRHVDESIAAKLDDAGWRAMHRAILAAALDVRPPLAAHAHTALEAARGRGCSTVLVSNAGTTPGFVLRQILEDYGVLPYLDHTVFSDEVELAKPNPAIFEHALELVGVEPQQAVFVGDQPVLDVLGPQNAGIWSIQVGALSEPGIEPHIRIAALDELDEAISRFEEA